MPLPQKQKVEDKPRLPAGQFDIRYQLARLPPMSNCSRLGALPATSLHRTLAEIPSLPWEQTSHKVTNGSQHMILYNPLLLL
jgi:hypothetical protein